jgi:UDP-N-acetylmuramate dehydrogenase
MLSTEETQQRLAEIPNLTVFLDAPLSRYTRFGIGGPADIYAETESVEAFVAALASTQASGSPAMVIGGGTNLIVSDAGFRGVVLRYRASSLTADGTRVWADAGAVLQDLIDFAVDRGLKGLETARRYSGLRGRRRLWQRRRIWPFHFRTHSKRVLLRWPLRARL